MLVSGILKILGQIANREDPDQTALGEAQIRIVKLTEKTLIILLKKQSDQGLLCCFCQSGSTMFVYALLAGN